MPVSMETDPVFKVRRWGHRKSSGQRQTSFEVRTNIGAQFCLSELRHKAALLLLEEERRDFNQNTRA
ncbi:hypothetical protein OIU78_021847 [Salix suchowensis]|nr:hypothetical protein OIU78_021847 [Salix suchowensis]